MFDKTILEASSYNKVCFRDGIWFCGMHNHLLPPPRGGVRAPQVELQVRDGLASANVRQSTKILILKHLRTWWRCILGCEFGCLNVWGDDGVNRTAQMPRMSG